MGHLDYLISKETIERIIKRLTPEQLILVWLLWNVNSRAQAAETLDISRQNLNYRLRKLREQIVSDNPDLAPAIEGRSFSTGGYRRR